MRAIIEEKDAKIQKLQDEVLQQQLELFRLRQPGAGVTDEASSIHTSSSDKQPLLPGVKLSLLANQDDAGLEADARAKLVRVTLQHTASYLEVLGCFLLREPLFGVSG